jgi:UDPglucose 6-dehydrogenase
MKLAVIGAGYVGLVSGACFAKLDHNVVCLDVDRVKIEKLRRGRVPIFEPGLAELVEAGAARGKLSFATDFSDAIAGADAVFVTVGTPLGADRRSPELSFVYDAARVIAAHVHRSTVIVIKSTVPVGTAEEVEAIIRKFRPGAEFAVVSNPEFLREGSAIADFEAPDRIVIGAEDEHARKMVSRLYAPLTANGVPILHTSRRTAELIKYAANAFLAAKIAFIGELADLCERAGADIGLVSNGMGMDKRIGAQFLQAGPGYGGSCFPKDTLALLGTARQYETRLQILESVVEVNETRKRAMAEKIIQACDGSVRGKRIAVLGLSFKPNTDDVREAASLSIIPVLQARGAQIRAYDPAGMQQARTILPRLEIAADPESCMRDADALVILTEWQEFQQLEPARISKLLRGRTVVDLRNIFDPAEMAISGFNYVSLGRPTIPPGRRDSAPAPRKRTARSRDGALAPALTSAG